MSRKLRPHDEEKRMRRVPSEDKTRLDKYSHLMYDLDKKSKIQRKHKPI